MGQARQLGALGRGGQERDAQLHHARAGPQGRCILKRGKVYALGEELTSDVPRVITPARIGIQVIQENDGYDRVAAKSGEFDPKRQQGAASFTFMHNHTGSHLDTLGHIYRENALYNNMPPPNALGTVQGDAASVIEMV